jgi:hypothetical protein
MSHVQTLSKMQNKKRKRQLSPDIIRPYKNKTGRQRGTKITDKNTDK